MSPLHAFLLGVLEGLTEFLPVSSTGHLFLLGLLFGHADEATKALDIVMQLGAVIAVIVYYRARLSSIARGVIKREPASLRLLLALALGFLPAGLVGLAFHKFIKSSLMSAGPIAGALIVGGIVMLVIEATRARKGDKGLDGLEHVSPKRALIIGVSQCFSLWPGTSRSMATIAGGQLSGLSTATAAEFSFLLAIPTLGAATVFDLIKHGHEIAAAPGGAIALFVSMSVSFAVALLVIAGFISYLKRFGLAPFGWYRIVLGVVVIALVLRSGHA
jgi:undecaprenyl-diphosphatase